jgi:hypothetical protein
MPSRGPPEIPASFPATASRGNRPGSRDAPEDTSLWKMVRVCRWRPIPLHSPTEGTALEEPTSFVVDGRRLTRWPASDREVHETG